MSYTHLTQDERYQIHARIYMESKKQNKLIDAWRNVPEDGSWRAWHASQAARDEEDRKRAAQKITSETIRNEVSAWKQGAIYDPNKHGVPILQSYVDSNLEFAGREFIEAQVKSKNPNAVADMWAKNTDFYPYFTTFVKNMLYVAYHAMTKPNTIDLNAQADMDVMTHLLHADVLVSNETRFLRTAFEDVWRPKGKVLFTSTQFANFLTKF